MLEFIGAQLGLATPFILVLAIWGAVRARQRDDERFLLLCLILSGAASIFLIHALHDRVQGNWPAFLYPMLAILAADAFGPWRLGVAWVSRLAMPVAALVLALLIFRPRPVFCRSRGDPLARLLGVGMCDTAVAADWCRGRKGASAILASDYETTAWLRFYAPHAHRWSQWMSPTGISKRPCVRAGQGPLLYLVDGEADQSAARGNFWHSRRNCADLVRGRRPSPARYSALADCRGHGSPSRQNALKK